MAKMAAYVPVAKPITPKAKMSASFVIVTLLTFGQSVTSSNNGGKIRAFTKHIVLIVR